MRAIVGGGVFSGQRGVIMVVVLFRREDIYFHG